MALDNLPAFKMFYFCSYIQILAELQQERKFKKHSLTSLWSDESSFCDLYDVGEKDHHLPYKSGSLGRLAPFSVAQQGQPLFFEGINGQRPIRITEH